MSRSFGRELAARNYREVCLAVADGYAARRSPAHVIALSDQLFARKGSVPSAMPRCTI
jgi:hypothetical protein